MSEIKLDVNGFLDTAPLKSGDKNNKVSSKIASGTNFKELLGNNVQLINSKNRNTEEMHTGFTGDNEEGDLLSKLSEGKSASELTPNKVSKAEIDIASKNIDKSLTGSVNLNNSLNNIMQLFNVNNKIEEDTTKAISSKDNESINDNIKKLVNLKSEIHKEIQMLNSEVRPIIDNMQLSSNMSVETVPKEFFENNIQLMNSNSEITEKMFNEFGKVTEDDSSLLKLGREDNSLRDLQKKLSFINNLSSEDTEKLNLLSEGDIISSENIEKLDLLSKLSEGKSLLELNNNGDVENTDKLNKETYKVMSNTINSSDKSSHVDLVQNLINTNSDKATEVLKKLVDLETKIDSLIGNISDKSASELDSTGFLNALLSKTSNKASKAETNMDFENIDKSSDTSFTESVNINNSLNNIMQLFNVNNKIEEDTTKAISSKDNESINDNIKKLVNLKSEIHKEIQMLNSEVIPIIDNMQLSSNMSVETVPKEFFENNIQLMNLNSEITEKMLNEFGKGTEDDNSLLKLSREDNSLQDLQKKLSSINDLSSEDTEKLNLLSEGDIISSENIEKLASLSEEKSLLELNNNGDVENTDKLNKETYNVMSNTINSSDKSSHVDLVQNLINTNSDKVTEVLKKLVDLETKIDSLIGNISDKSASELDSTGFLNALLSKTSNKASKAISSKDNGINDNIKKLVNLKSEIYKEIQMLNSEVRPIIDNMQLSSNMSVETVPKEFSGNDIELMNSKREITEKMLNEFAKVTEDDSSLLQFISKGDSLQSLNDKLSVKNALSSKSSSVDLVQNLVSTNTDKVNEVKPIIDNVQLSSNMSVETMTKEFFENNINFTNYNSEIMKEISNEFAKVTKDNNSLLQLISKDNSIQDLQKKLSEGNSLSYKDNNTMNSTTNFVNPKNNNLLMQPLQQEHQRNINKKVPAKENLIESKIFNNSLKDNQLKGTIINDEVDLLSSKNEHKSEFKNNNSFNSENKFLKGLLEDSKNMKFDKINTLMGQLIVQNQNDSQEIVNAPKVINKSNFTSDIIKSISYMETKDIRDMIVKINPKELGEIYIKITATADGIMKANISANSRETFNLLNAHVQDLNNSLNNSQIKIQHIDINIYNGDTTFFSNNFNQSQGDKNNSQSQNYNSVSYINGEEEPAASEETIYEDNKLNTLA